MTTPVGMRLALEGEKQYSESLKQIQQKSKELAAEMKSVVSSGASEEKQMEVLSKQIENQQTLIGQLSTKYEKQQKDIESTRKAIEEAKKAYGDNSLEVQKLETQLIKQETALSKTKTQINNETDALNKMEKGEESATKDTDALGDATEEAGKQARDAGNDGFTVFKGVVANLATDAIKSAVEGLKNLANGIKEAILETAEYGNEVDKQSQKLGMSAETYQELAYAMEMSGADVEDFKKGMINMNDALADFASGSTDAAETYEELGVSLTDSEGNLKNSEQLLMDTVDALASMEDETKRDAAAQKIFGKKMTELRPLLNSGSKAIKDLMQEAKDYGMVMSDDAVQASADFEDSMTRLKNTANGLKRTMVSEFLPGLSQVADGFSKMVAGVDGGAEDLRAGILNIISNINEKVPEFIQVGKEIFTSVLQGFVDNLPDIVTSITGIIPDLFNAIADTIETIDIAELVKTVFDCANSIIKAIVPRLPELLTQLIVGIIEALPELFIGVGETIYNIFDGIFGGYTQFDEFKGVIDRQTEAWQGVTGAMEESVDQINTDAQTWSDQWELLQSITDESGKVKEGYEGMADALINELNDALGLNIEYQDGQIQNYDAICQSIDEVMAKKRAEMLLEAEGEAYTEALKMRPELVSAVTDAENNLTAAQQALTEAQNAYNGAVESGGDLTMLTANLDNAKMSVIDMQTALDDAETNLSENTALMTQYMSDYSAAMQGDYASIGQTTKQYTGETKAELESYRDSVKKTLQDDTTNHEYWLKNYKETNSSYAKEQANTYAARMKTDQTQLNAINKVIEQGGKDYSSGYVNGILSGEKDAKNAGKTIGDDAVNALQNAQQSNSPSKLTNGLGSDFGAGYVQGIESQSYSAQSAGSSLSSSAASGLSSYQSSAYSTGQSTAIGFGNGIGAMANYIWNCAQSIASTALNAIRSTLDVHSPSKETEWIGEMLGEGLAEGIESSTKTAVNAMRNMASDVAGVDFSLNAPSYRSAAGVIGASAIQNNTTINVTVNGTEGQDVNALADAVIDRIEMQIDRRSAIYA